LCLPFAACHCFILCVSAFQKRCPLPDGRCGNAGAFAAADPDQNWRFKLDNGIEIVLPKGFKFDGASVPRIFWAILSPVGLLLIPGLIHDYGYRFNQIWHLNANGEIEPYMKQAGRKAWDNLFQSVGIQVNGFALIDFIAWVGVRAGGCFAWRKHRKEHEIPQPPDI
jgi:hypothetical protein